MQTTAEKREEWQRRIGLLGRLILINSKKLEDLKASCTHEYVVLDQQIADVEWMSWRITLQCRHCEKQAQYAGQNPAKGLDQNAVVELPRCWLDALLPTPKRGPQFPNPICPVHWVLMCNASDETSVSASILADQNLCIKRVRPSPFSHRTWKCPECDERVTRLVEMTP